MDVPRLSITKVMDGPRISKATEVHDLDSLFKPLGGFGRFQIYNLLCLSTIILLCTFSELGYIMTTAELKHRCHIPECEAANTTYAADNSTWLTSAIPQTSLEEFDSCLRYAPLDDGCSDSSFSNDTFECTEFVYESEEHTVHREDWGIHCDSQRYQLALVGSVNNAGQVFGSIYAGYLQDRFGRKSALVSITLAVAVFGCIKSFAVNYAMLITMEALETIAAVGMFNGPFVLALEIVEPGHRVMAGTIVAMAYPAGEMILGYVQYLTFEWRSTIRICYFPFILTIAYFWLLPESVRWLLGQGRYDDAVDVLHKIAKTNGKDFPEREVKNVLEAETAKAKLEETDGKGSNYQELWKSGEMRLRIFANLVARMCALFVYFGITLNSVSISNDKFLNFILTGLIEMPGYISVLILMDRIGRKVSLWAHLALCGVACILTGYVPEEWGWVRLSLYLIGKFGASGGLFVSDVYTAEMFPTFIRSTMLSVSVLVGKLASIVAPEIPLLSEFYAPLPVLIFGVTALIGAAASLVFPETLDCKLPDTVEEAENLGKKAKQDVET